MASFWSSNPEIVNTSQKTFPQLLYRIKKEKWRINYEKKHDLEREFFRIINIEDDEKRKDEIEKIMNSEYRRAIEKWLRENYKHG